MASDAAIWLHPAFWAAVSFLAVFLVAGFVVLDRPRKWWLLVVAAVAAFVLFDLFGLLGFLSALGFKLWRAQAVLKKEASEKKDAARVRPLRKKNHPET